MRRSPRPRTGTTAETHGIRQEIFAVAEDGTSVQLTNDPDVLLWIPQWVADPVVGGDATIVAFGLDFTGGTLVEGGLYRADVTFDTTYDGAVTGLAAPATLYASFPIVTDSGPPEAPDLSSFSFAPDGARFAYRQRSTQKLWVWDAGTSSLLIDGGSSPSWSPDGTKIAYAWQGIYTIKPDGSGNNRLVRARAKTTLRRPSWSPTASHVVYHVSNNITGEFDIYRIGAGGSGKLNLTSDIESATALGWR